MFKAYNVITVTTDTVLFGLCCFHAQGPGIGPPGATPGMPHIPPGPLVIELQLRRQWLQSVAVQSYTLYWPGQNPLPGQPGDWDESADQMDLLYVLFQ